MTPDDLGAGLALIAQSSAADGIDAQKGSIDMPTIPTMPKKRPIKPPATNHRLGVLRFSFVAGVLWLFGCETPLGEDIRTFCSVVGEVKKADSDPVEQADLLHERVRKEINTSEFTTFYKTLEALEPDERYDKLLSTAKQENLGAWGCPTARVLWKEWGEHERLAAYDAEQERLAAETAEAEQAVSKSNGRESKRKVKKSRKGKRKKRGKKRRRQRTRLSRRM